MAALWIGFEGWLLGGFIFDFPPSISWRAAFFYVIIYARLHSRARLLELVVVSNCAFCVNYHSRRHQPRLGAHSKIQPDLRLIDCELVSLHALR